MLALGVSTRFKSSLDSACSLGVGEGNITNKR